MNKITYKLLDILCHLDFSLVYLKFIGVVKILRLNMVAIRETDIYNKEALTSLKKHLPFSTNAIHSVINYPDKTSLLYMDTGTNHIWLISYLSGYNPHIWYSPIIWAVPERSLLNECDIRQAINFLENAYGSFIMMIPYELPAGMDLIGLKIYHEFLMMRDIIPSPLKSDSQIRRLTPEDASESLRMSAGIEPYDERIEPVDAEKLFLLQRETYGIFKDRKLVCRGSIMANFGIYQTVGGFVTDPEYRGMGLATKLVEFICGTVEARGGKPCLTVRNTNEAAIRLYKKLEFREIQRITFIDCNSGVVP